MAYTTQAKVKISAHNIGDTEGRVAALTGSELDQFIAEADEVINSKLSALFFTPLQTITRDNVTKYPDPVPYIATRIAAALAVITIYSRIDPQQSENARTHFENALRELDDMYQGAVMGSRRLDGQKLKAKTPFLNPYAAPLEPPKGPLGTI